MPAEPLSPTLHAAQLLRLWNDLARRHVSMGAGCGCGIGGVAVRLGDFEHDIVDYLCDEAQRQGRQDVLDLLRRAADLAETGAEEVAGVLAALADEEQPAPPAVAAWLLPRLDRTLSSFARLHGGPRPAPGTVP